MADVVIAWELAHPALTGAMVGVRNEKEAREIEGGVELRLSPEELAAIDEALKVWE